MIVDPMTGQPVGTTGNGEMPQSTLGAVGQSVMSDPNSLSYQIAGNIPAASTMIGWNMARGMNSIMSPRRPLTNLGMRNNWPGRFINTLSPSRFFRLPGPDSVFQNNPDFYTPYNSAASFGNTIAQRVAAKSAANGSGGFAARQLQSMLGLSDSEAKTVMEDIGEGRSKVFDGGTLARLGVANRLSGMDRNNMSRRDLRRLSSSVSALEKAGVIKPGMANTRLMQNPARVAEMTLRSFKGRYTQRVAGYVGGMMNVTHGGLGAAASSQIYDNAFNASRATMRKGALSMGLDLDDVLSKKTFGSAKLGIEALTKRGGDAAMKRFGGAMLGKAAFTGGAKAIPVLGQIMLARDIMAMGIAGIKKGAEFARDATKSFQGQIQKPIFGMGYKDNAINATSRARGLTAIQESRLNARNALGHEAGMLASHFG